MTDHLIDGLARVDRSLNKVIDLNTLMSAFDNYIDAVTQPTGGVAGVPIGFLFRKVNAAQVARLWLDKYYGQKAAPAVRPQGPPDPYEGRKKLLVVGGTSGMGYEDALATATGVAALAAIFLTFLKAGDHLIVSDVCYAGANELARRILPDFGIEVSAVNLSKPEDLRAALRPNTKLVHCESPCNPLLRLTDLRKIAEITHAHGALMSVDSTFATPVATQPLKFGADLVMHSLTKFINGHGDALGGIVAGRKELTEKMRGRAGVYLGASLSAMNAWLILRGIDTLYPRMRQIHETAQNIAAFLEAHPAVKRVIYPGLASHPQADLARAQMAIAGGVITFQTADPQAMARQLSERLKVAHYAFSLGHQRSIVVLLDTAEMMASSYQLEGAQFEDYRNYAGEGVFRLSVGLEDCADLRADLDQALRM